VGEDYIEQVAQKRRSIRADAAFVVSSSGFYGAALKKAQALNIRLFTFKEAVSTDWMQCLQLREITQFSNRWDNLVVLFLEPETNQIVPPHESLLAAIDADVRAKVLVDELGQPKFSLGEIAGMIVNQNSDYFFQEATIVSGRHRKHVVVNLCASPNQTPLYFKDYSGTLRKLEKLGVEMDCWKEAIKIPLYVSKYFDPGTGQPLAEVASATVNVWGGPHKFEILAKFLGDKGEDGTKVLMRMHKTEDVSTEERGSEPKK
jgi:hypothetical protein